MFNKLVSTVLLFFVLAQGAMSVPQGGPIQLLCGAGAHPVIYAAALAPQASTYSKALELTVPEAAKMGRWRVLFRPNRPPETDTQWQALRALRRCKDRYHKGVYMIRTEICISLVSSYGVDEIGSRETDIPQTTPPEIRERKVKG
ncbi:hypothetical protein B0H19DRAFT_1080408 [Mycena capillaripes]|nr:hypothetical protein B0H19DRAFT_1080408 [Mycena capillaripes]